MKTALIGLAALSLASPSFAYEPDQTRAAIQVYFNSTAEPTVKDSVWTNERTFKVGVIDNKAPRDGFSNYVCEVIAERGLRNQRIRVHVIDITKLVRTKKWEKLGEAACR